LVGQVARLFRRLGYRVHRRPATHDLGVDLVVSKSGWRAIVQCKNWHHPVGPAAVRDLYGTLLHTGADLGILVTTSTTSRSAQEFCSGKPLLLIEGSVLRLLLDGL
jgi:restriction system protein